ncbi:MAG: hypothetical protein LUE21_08320 [Oscillospiraceae bacterium]|nr:hypothetical protein [Oscillospiraceae bacterium]
MKRIIATVLALTLCLSGLALGAWASSEEPSASGEFSLTDRQNGRTGGGSVDKSDDEELAALLAEVEEKFQQLDYQDEETGRSFSYNLFVPEDYDETQAYPLVLFIPDSSVVGGETTDALEQGYGALVWATEEDQEKHPCFVLAPEYPENILDGEEDVTDYVAATLNLLAALQETYNIDENRLYITGQSMGCMTALYLNGTYPDLFAASLYVDGQWPVEILAALEEQPFFYFAAEGDEKASQGMANVMAMFDEDGVAYGQARLNAKDDTEVIEETVQTLIDEGYLANFIAWEEGSVLPDGMDAASTGSEHMYSFDHAYKISAVRDWLFQQVKE